MKHEAKLHASKSSQKTAASDFLSQAGNLFPLVDDSWKESKWFLEFQIQEFLAQQLHNCHLQPDTDKRVLIYIFFNFFLLIFPCSIKRLQSELHILPVKLNGGFSRLELSPASQPSQPRDLDREFNQILLWPLCCWTFTHKHTATLRSKMQTVIFA